MPSFPTMPNPAKPSPIKPVMLTDQIYQVLKHRVLTCQLRPGERLVEKKLCEELGVSRTSLREGMNRLAQEKLLTLKPNCGFMVTPITLDSFRNICELRLVVESQVAALAAERAGPEDISAIRQAASLTADPRESSDAYLEYVRTNRHFHQCVAQSIDNILIEEIVLNALDKDHQPLYYGIDLELCTSDTDITQEHCSIAEAIAEHDAEKARLLMADHIGKKEHRILDALRQHGLE